MAFGARGHIGIAKETTWGTAVAASDYFEALSESIVTNIERFDVRNIFGGMYEPDDEAGVVRHAGDIILPAHPVSIGFFLNGALGVNSVTAVLSGVLFTNQFTPVTSDTGSLSALPAYTLEVFRDVTSSQQYAGAQFNTLELSVTPNQELRATVGVIAKTRAGLAATTPSFPGSPTGVFKFNTASVSLGGNAIARLENFTLTFDNQLEGIPVLNAANEVARIHRTGPQLVRVTGTAAFDNTTDFDSFINETEQRLFLNFTRADSFSLLIDIPRAIFTEHPQQITGRDRLTVDFAMIGRFDTGSNTALDIRLTSTTTF